MDRPFINKNVYEVLGVPKDAQVAEVEKAFRKLSLKYHPDKANAATAHRSSETDAERTAREKTNNDRYLIIVKCRDILSDESLRTRYDKELRYVKQHGYTSGYFNVWSGASDFGGRGDDDSVWSGFGCDTRSNHTTKAKTNPKSSTSRQAGSRSHGTKDGHGKYHDAAPKRKKTRDEKRRPDNPFEPRRAEPNRPQSRPDFRPPPNPFTRRPGEPFTRMPERPPAGGKTHDPRSPLIPEENADDFDKDFEKEAKTYIDKRERRRPRVREFYEPTSLQIPDRLRTLDKRVQDVEDVAYDLRTALYKIDAAAARARSRGWESRDDELVGAEVRAELDIVDSQNDAAIRSLRRDRNRLADEYDAQLDRFRRTGWGRTFRGDVGNLALSDVERYLGDADRRMDALERLVGEGLPLYDADLRTGKAVWGEIRDCLRRWPDP